MRRRIFVAINLEPQALNMIERLAHDLGLTVNHKARFVSPQNWHLTLSFLGYQDETATIKISESIRETASRFEAPLIALTRLLYGPPGASPRPPKFSERKLGRPSMIWLLASKETSLRLNEIKQALEDELDKRGVAFKRESRLFSGHLTLARFESAAKISDLPKIDKEINIASGSESLDLMESELKRGGAEYTIIQKFDFGGGGQT